MRHPDSVLVVVGSLRNLRRRRRACLENRDVAAVSAIFPSQGGDFFAISQSHVALNSWLTRRALRRFYRSARC